MKGNNKMESLDAVLKISKKIRLLYVEDNEIARESTLGLLSNIFTDITIAVDGEDGLNKFMQDKIKYDLIISDMNMPNMDGEKMITKIQELDSTINIFVLSAHNEIDKNLIDKVQAYLPKPIDFMKLLKEIKSNF